MEESSRLLLWLFFLKRSINLVKWQRWHSLRLHLLVLVFVAPGHTKPLTGAIIYVGLKLRLHILLKWKLPKVIKVF